METLSDSLITFLDDEKLHLEAARKIFDPKMYVIRTTDSIHDAKMSVLSGDVDVFICDLRLDQIGGEAGNIILLDLRKKKKDVFLALYTSFVQDLSSSAKRTLIDNQIKIYDKGDDSSVFLENLEKDYLTFKKSHKSEKDNSGKTFADVIGPEVKTQILTHLKGVSNPEMRVSINDLEKGISVSELINEVERETDIGKKYGLQWLKTVMLILKIKEAKK